MAKELADVRHPVQHADSDQGHVEAAMKFSRQMMDVRLDELGCIRRVRRQLPGLIEKRCGLIDAHHATGTQRIQ